jgi:putative Mn2+ efflux pump MntP
LLLIPSLVLGAVSGAVGWPITTALNSHWSSAAKLVAAAMTIGLGCAIVYGVARRIGRPAVDLDDVSLDVAGGEAKRPRRPIESPARVAVGIERAAS